MTIEEINFLRECLDLRRKPFYYFKDKYALQLLAYQVGKGMSISSLKKTAMGFLLEKPLLKTLTAQLGSNQMTNTHLQTCWPTYPLVFKPSLGQWGEFQRGEHSTWRQTSRPGYNLVLRLNFSQHHDQAYRELIRPHEGEAPFVRYSHPVEEGSLHTMAWVRMDLDWESGEALIEEIQNDWLREAQGLRTWLQKQYERDQHYVHRHWLFEDTDSSYGRFDRYCRDILQPYQEIWEEAALSAAIWLIREELGIERIFYHTFDTGNRIKHITDEKPPRSLYTQLPDALDSRRQMRCQRFLSPSDESGSWRNGTHCAGFC